MSKTKIIVAVGLLSLVGCQACPEKAVLRESMNQGSQTAWSDAVEWGKQLVVYPAGQNDPRTEQPSDGKNKAGAIQPLTPAAYDQLLKTKAEYDAFVTNDRNRK